LQIKDENWRGKFVDLVDGQAIEDRDMGKFMIAMDMITKKKFVL